MKNKKTNILTYTLVASVVLCVATFQASNVPASSIAPRLSGIALSGGSVLISGSGGLPGTTSYLLGSTNAALPITNWTRVATNVFDNSGSFVFTNAIDPEMPHRFYLMQQP